MLLSVIIPVFNGAGFIHKAYQAILDQEVVDFEILFVDNNSTDTSVSIIKELCRRDTRVQLLFQKVQGAGASRNLGIQNAKGDFVYLFDVDDELYPNAISKMMTALKQYPSAQAVVGKMVKSKKDLLNTPKPKDETFNHCLVAPPTLGLIWFEDLKMVVGPPAFLYKRAVFGMIGGYNEALRIGQDTAFDIKLGMSCPIVQLDAYVYLYRKHERSTTQIVKKKNELIFHTWNRLVKEHFPFYLNNTVPEKFKYLLFRQLFSGLGKILFHTKGLKNRLRIYPELLRALEPVKIPFYIKCYLSILVVLPNQALLKFYIYYLSKWYLERHINDL